MPKICVQSQGKQFRVTIPRKLALAFEMKAGDPITWRVIGKNRLELVKK
ncbi:MAG: hypothetical protein NTY20_02560 [Candidatus Aenigmarchaeota archaeon]|nr:hypothetical protein [Candidatus Aenigmarchaeota archaeon]